MWRTVASYKYLRPLNVNELGSINEVEQVSDIKDEAKRRETKIKAELSQHLEADKLLILPSKKLYSSGNQRTKEIFKTAKIETRENLNVYGTLQNGK